MGNVRSHLRCQNTTRLRSDSFEDALNSSAEDWDEGLAEFSLDWKLGSDVEKQSQKKYGHTFDATRQVRTRTAVDANNIAETGKLFTYSAVFPGEHVWKGKSCRRTIRCRLCVNSSARSRLKSRELARQKSQPALPESLSNPSRQQVWQNACELFPETAACLQHSGRYLRICR